jgi:hypothetical protein
MARLDAGGNARVRSQVVDQPKTRANDHNNDEGSSRVLAHAPAVFLIVELAHGIAQGVLGRLR